MTASMNPTEATLEVVRKSGHVPMEMWGKDHRVTLLYAETRAVDYRGKIDRNHMREDGERYPTYLAGGVQLRGHNDYDCLTDAEHAGLLTPSLDGTVVFTDQGWAYVSGLRRERAERMLARGADRAMAPS